MGGLNRGDLLYWTNIRGGLNRGVSQTRTHIKGGVNKKGFIEPLSWVVSTVSDPDETHLLRWPC
jgi:hypothetical protein